MANLGCSRCKKVFPGGVGHKDFSGFDRENWNNRSNEEHRHEMEVLQQCKTQTERISKESEFGSRYTALSELPYYDTIAMAIVDPMHNLFLGTAKNMINVWKKNGILNDISLQQIQEKVDKAEVPSDVGKLPGKIDKFSFDGFTADEIKNWTLIFSIYALHGILPKRHLECWRLFVISCQYLCNQAITKADIIIADQYMVKFCRRFEELYGQDHVTPNMHLHAHLKECIEDFGPIYNFWLFSFERYNGLLGNYPTNRRMIEIQMMKRFFRETSLLATSLPNESSMLRDCYERLSSNTQRGTLGQIEVANKMIPFVRMSSKFTDYSAIEWTDIRSIEFSNALRKYTLSSNEYTHLVSFYKNIYASIDTIEVDNISRSCYKTKQVYNLGDIYGCKNSRSERSSYILAYWCDEGGQIKPFSAMYNIPRPGRINYFIKHVIYINQVPHEHVLANVEWFLPLPDEQCHYFGKPVQLWCATTFENPGPASFIPVQRIKTKFVHISERMFGREVLVVLPRYRFYSI